MRKRGQWRVEPALAAAELVNSPYDLDARYGKKRTTLWVGFKVHFTQTCDEDAPQLITHVQTTHAAVNDEKALSKVHAGLAEKDLLPDQHLVDAGYVDATNLIESRAGYGVDLVGPPSRITGIKPRPAMSLPHFSIDWQAQTVTCPQGHTSSSWTPAEACQRQTRHQSEVLPNRL